MIQIKHLRFAALLFVISQSFQALATEVIYKTYYNDKQSTETADIKLVSEKGFVVISSEINRDLYVPEMIHELNYIDYHQKSVFKVLTNKSGDKYYTENAFASLPVFQVTNEVTKIKIGKKEYTCKKAETVIFSNKIECWYTTDIKDEGSPSPLSGLVPGLVLKYVRNGNYMLLASEIKSKHEPIKYAGNNGIKVDAPAYYARSAENYTESVRVFDNEQICWGWDDSNQIFDSLKQVYHYVNGTVILRKVKLPKVSQHTTIYAELTQASNGDAYDRTGSVFIVPIDKKQSFLDGLQKGLSALPVYTTKTSSYQGVALTANFSPLIELMRFFTPFGVGYFNEKRTVEGMEWEKEAFYRQEVTELASHLQDEVWIGTFIGNYDKGGHKITLDLKYHVGALKKAEANKVLNSDFVLPLFNTLNVMEMAGQNYGTMFLNDTLSVQFDIPEGVRNLHFRYISTGHGGWGNGDEYNKKVNTIFIDGIEILHHIPWRSDCGTYRKYNPASGNFWNGISSSDGSRSGWCPGTITNPVYVDLPDLKPGKHEIRVAIPMGKAEGNSFSSWCVSGLLIGNSNR